MKGKYVIPLCYKVLSREPPGAKHPEVLKGHEYGPAFQHPSDQNNKEQLQKSSP